ncbi:MAG: hypothetical protein J7L14_02680 [Candidatus Diapherotrites archaeon]|nr:hypothetical protein [Candidatus Diapherotrites archaeon]
MRNKDYRKKYDEFFIDIDSIEEVVTEVIEELFKHSSKFPKAEFVIGFELSRDEQGRPVLIAKRADIAEIQQFADSNAETLAEVEELNGKTIITTLLNIAEINKLGIQTENDRIVKIIVDDKVAKEIRLKKEILPRTLKWSFKNNVLEIWFRQKKN